jgi:ADP-ribose pyrophosphatase
VLPEIPKVELVVIADRSGEPNGFLSLERVDLVVRHADRTESAPVRYDIVTRAALDAVVIVAHYVRDGVRQVFLRSSVRPPAALRRIAPKHDGLLWEVPAGLIEPGEASEVAAARELEEELGFVVSLERLAPLGTWSFAAPGFIGEAHHFFHCEVDPAARREPQGDGSPLEEGASIIEVPIAEALDACRAGLIRDAKTELALRRMADVAVRDVER